MKKFFYFFIPLLFILSCTKEENANLAPDRIENDDVTETFVKILSKAVCSNVDLRNFLKNEALVQFDKDYDVFYPLEKGKKINDDKTFRECLLEDSDEPTLRQIEKQKPLLDILIPDWSWIKAFDVHSWNTISNDVLVGFVNNHGEHVVYENGNKCGILDKGVFLCSPILIVKDCERMKITNQPTKSSGIYEYTFSNESFNPLSTKGVAVETSFIHPATNPGSNWVDVASFKLGCPEIVASWEEYGLDPYEMQRKYAYYGMKKGDTEGIFNPQIRESVFAIRLNNTNCIDDQNDPNLKSITKEKSDYNNEDDIVNAIWSDGQFEILLRASVTDENRNTKVLNENVIPVDGKNLFDIETIKKEFRHKTWFSSRKFTYIAKLSDLKPKWYYLPSPLAFSSWDPAGTSSIVNIHAYEVDPSVTISVTDSVKAQKGVKASASVLKWISFTFDSNSKIETETETYQITKGSDDLGQKEIRFSDSIILGEKNNAYELGYYSTGNLDFIVAPQSRIK